MKRIAAQVLSDDFKQECTLMLTGLHPMCSQLPSKFVQSVLAKEIDNLTENQQVILHITTLNCAAKQPDSYKELVPIFKRQIEGVDPDIMVIGLQEIVTLNAMSIFQGENQAKMNEWEQLLRLSIEMSTERRDPDERYVWVIAKSMVGCYIGLFVK